MKSLILTCLLCFTTFIGAVNSANSYTSQLSEYAMAVLKTVESEPQKALESVQNYQPSSSVDLAQKHLLYAQIYGGLDYPQKMLSHSELGLGAIDSDQEPWLSHLLTINKIDAQDRLGQRVGNTQIIKDIISWSKDREHNILASIAMIQLSYLYTSVEDYNQALIILQEAEQTAPIEGELLNKSDVAPHIAGIYVYRNEFELALPYFETAFEQEKKENNILGMSIQLFELGRANLELDNLELGITQLQQSIDLSESINDVQGVAYATTELANHFINQEDHQQAETLLVTASELFADAENSYMLFDNHILLTKLHTATGQFADAQHYLSLAEEVAQKQEFRYAQTTIDKRKGHLLAAMGKHQEAFDLFVAATRKQAELESQHSTEKLHEIRARYELEQNAINNQLLQEQNSAQSETIANQAKQRLMLVVILILLAAFSFVLIAFNRKLSKQGKKLHELANFDELTGLRNRANIINSIRRKLLKMGDQDIITLVMIDLDHFKHINDTYGHALGDKVLRLFGSYCKELETDRQRIGRLGGEEFLIVFLGTDKARINHLIDQLRIRTERMSEHIGAPGLRVSMSAGICHSQGKHRFRDILKCADEAMYQAKNNGRNQIVTIELD